MGRASGPADRAVSVGTAGAREASLAGIARDERRLAESWPPEVSEGAHGWRLRASGGATRRGNSVLALAFDGGDVHAAVDRAEAWYRERGLPACFMISPAARPDGLDRSLEGRGYRREGDSIVMAAPLPPSGLPAGIGLRRHERPTDAWLDVAGEGRTGAAAAAWAGIVGRTPGAGSAAFVENRSGGTVAAVGGGVVIDRTLCIFCMFTRPAARRAGLARAVLAHLIQWASGVAADRILLQVEGGNEAARRLYRSFGLRDLYPYHYRIGGGTR